MVLPGGPKSMIGVLIRDTQREVLAKMEAKTRGTQPQPRKPRGPRELGEAGRSLPLEPLEVARPRHTWIPVSCLQNGERMHSCCFQPPGLGNSYSSPGRLQAGPPAAGTPAVDAHSSTPPSEGSRPGRDQS